MSQRDKPETVDNCKILVKSLAVNGQIQRLVGLIFFACRNSDVSCDDAERGYVFRKDSPCTESGMEILGCSLVLLAHAGSGSVAGCSVPDRLCAEKHRKIYPLMLHRLHRRNTEGHQLRHAKRAYER